MSDDDKFQVINKVDGVDEEEYTEHQDCIGHMRVLRGVLILPPEASANRHGLVNDQAKKAMSVSAGFSDSDQYRRWVESTIRGKSGVMRGDATGFTVDGSIRMVIAPAPELEMYEISVPA